MLEKIKSINPKIKILSFDFLSADHKDDEDIKKLRMYLENVLDYQYDTALS
jgi:hypothetical protein